MWHFFRYKYKTFVYLDENVPDSKVDFVDVSEESEEVSEESNEDEAEEQQENVPSTTVNDEDYEDEHAGMEEEPVRELIKPAQPAHIQTNNIQVAQKVSFQTSI